MNSCFLEKNSKVEYHQIDEVIQMALALGTVAKGTRGARTPNKHYFLGDLGMPES